MAVICKQVLTSFTRPIQILTRSSVQPALASRRLFYSWLIEVFNRKDVERVKQIGSDRGAAEWMLRNGGKIKFSQSITWLSNYGNITSGNVELVSIDASGVSVTNSGLQHLIGLKHLQYLDLNGCRHITDLDHLNEVAGTLEYLDIGNCAGLSDVSHVANLTKLQTLIITGTLGGAQRSKVIDTLKKKLPSCEITD